jgi:hypothetical protein
LSAPFVIKQTKQQQQPERTTRTFHGVKMCQNVSFEALAFCWASLKRCCGTF